jgi:hypothetical protein
MLSSLFTVHCSSNFALILENFKSVNINIYYPIIMLKVVIDMRCSLHLLIEMDLQLLAVGI